MAKVAHLVDASTIALYRLRGDGSDGETDLAGSYDLTLSVGDPLARVAGHFGFARHFTGDGAGHFGADLPYTSTLENLLDGCTVEALIRVPDLTFTSDDPVVFSIWGRHVDGYELLFLQLQVEVATRQLYATYSWDLGANIVELDSGSYTIPIATWTHVAVRSSGTRTDDQTLTISVNGVEVARVENSNTPDVLDDLDQPAQLLLGANTTYPLLFLGDVEEFALRSDVRSDAQLVADAAGHALSETPASAPVEAWTSAPRPALDVARDFKIDLATNEIALGPDGDWALVRGLDAIVQDAHTALSFIRGEWFLDTTFGFGLLDTVLVKSPSVDLIRAEVRRVLLTVTGIVAVASVDVTLDRATRLARVQWSASTDVGELLNQTTRILA